MYKKAGKRMFKWTEKEENKRNGGATEGINTEEHNCYEGPPESQQMRKNEGIDKYTSSQVIPCRPEHYTTHLCFSADPTGTHSHVL